MVCQKSGKEYLAGLVSWGTICGHAKLPGVYTHIWPFRPWLSSNLALEDLTNGDQDNVSILQIKCISLVFS